jgi:hypothetical protein
MNKLFLIFVAATLLSCSADEVVEAKKEECCEKILYRRIYSNNSQTSFWYDLELRDECTRGIRWKSTKAYGSNNLFPVGDCYNEN